MSGEEIKKIIKEKGLVISDIAKMLGYDNDQRLHSALKSADIKTGLIADISRVANISIGELFGEKQTISGSITGDIKGKNIRANNNSNNGDSTSTQELLMKVKHLESVIEQKDILLGQKDTLIQQMEKMLELARVSKQ